MHRITTSPRRIRRLALAGMLLALALPASPALAATIGSAFTYQGSLSDGGVPPTAQYDFRFALFDAAAGGSQIAGTVALEDVQVVSGVFAVDLDFGSSAFLGDARWLQVEVRPGASTGLYTTLPRQRLGPSPFAIGLSLPHEQVMSSSAPLFKMRNTGTGNGAEFSAAGTAVNYGVIGRNSSTGFNAAGVRGVADANSGVVIGVEGVAANSDAGTGLVGSGRATGAYITGTGSASTGLYAYGYALGIHAQNLGTGSALYAVGNGTGRENATVRIVNNQASAGMCQVVTNNSTWATTHMQNDGSGEVLWLQRGATAGNYIVATGPTGWKFWVDASGVTHTKVLEILGGSDLSERFDVADPQQVIEPGTVMCIDPAHEGHLQVSREPYDRRVAGIVSGAGGVNPGMIMGQEGTVATGEHPVALTGRVYCRVTAANGPVVPGDLLTTSSVPGCAMRASDHAAAQGAVLGKAMGSLEEGEGLVLVLVGLQ